MRCLKVGCNKLGQTLAVWNGNDLVYCEDHAFVGKNFVDQVKKAKKAKKERKGK